MKSLVRRGLQVLVALGCMGLWVPLSGCGRVARPVVSLGPAVVGNVVLNPAYELDAFDVQGTLAYVVGDNGNQGSGSTAAAFFVVDLTNPANPTVVSTTPITGAENYGQSGLRVQGQYVYVESSTGTAATNLLQIFDVSKPSAPVFVGSVEIPLYSLGLWISGNYAYVISYVGDSSAGVLSVVDVSNPVAPKVVGSADTGIAGVHGADIKVVGTYAYVAGQSGATSYVLVFDVSNAASPFVASRLPVEHSPQGLDVQGHLWYQSIYDANLLNIYDTSNPSSISQTGTVSLLSTCKPQDVVVEGTTAYVACYMSSSLVVVDVSSAVAPSVKGYIALPAISYPLFLEARGRYLYSISNAPGGVLSVIDVGN